MNKVNLILFFGQTPYQVFKEPHKGKNVKINSKNDLSNLKGDINSLSYQKKYSLDEKIEDDPISSFSKIFNPSKNETIAKAPCIYFDIYRPSEKIFALSYKEIVEINFVINNENDSNILIFRYLDIFEIPRTINFKAFHNKN